MTAPAHQHATSRGRPHLGPRTVVTAALCCGLEQVVDDARGGLDRSPYLADLLAWHVGRADVIRHNQLAMEFSTSSRPAFAVCRSSGTRTRHCTVRVHPDVARELDRGARESGLPRGVYIADAIAKSLGVRRGNGGLKEGGLPLAM